MKELEMKKCKECGKMFMPTSNKQKYCTDVHYRPCPVCGKPVVAKYLSDPARCCSGVCKATLGKMNKQVSKLAEFKQPETVEDLKRDINPLDIKKYVGRESNGFETGKEYQVSYSCAGKGQHIITSHYNITDDVPISLSYEFSNKKHISKYFKSVRQ